MALKSILSKFTRFDYIVTTLLLFLLAVALIAFVFFGSSERYSRLVQTGIDPWLLRGGWVVVTVLSYAGFYVLWNALGEDSSRDIVLNALLLINAFVFIGWAAVTYYCEDLAVAFWYSLVLLMYNVAFVTYIFTLNPWAGLLMLPSLILYVLLVYSAASVASLNGQTV